MSVYERLYNLQKSEHALSNILNRRIKISCYGDLNDPFELMSADLSNKDFRRAITFMKQNSFNSKGLICFSKDWTNPVLWSHYADKHRGIALGFDVLKKYAAPIKYSETRLPIDHKVLNHSDVHEMLHTKFANWAYENEIRMHVSLDESTKENDKYFYGFNESLILKEVILGHSCPENVIEIREKLKKIYPTIIVHQARLGFKKFEVVINQQHNIYR